MLEHLDRHEARLFLAEAMRVLRPGGVLRLAVPDIRQLVQNYMTTGDADEFVASTLMCVPLPRGHGITTGCTMAPPCPSSLWPKGLSTRSWCRPAKRLYLSPENLIYSSGTRRASSSKPERQCKLSNGRRPVRRKKKASMNSFSPAASGAVLPANQSCVAETGKLERFEHAVHPDVVGARRQSRYSLARQG
jgi:hypothetical protein